MCDLGVDWISPRLKLNQEEKGKFTFDLEQRLPGLLDGLLAQHKGEGQTASFTRNEASGSTGAPKPLP